MNLEMIESSLLSGANHGFFTRKGGVSTGLYHSLNCGLGSGDQIESALMNRSLVARALNVPPANLRSVHQIHSTEVVVVGRDWPDPRPQADAMVTREKGIALGILTADCAPILFHDPVAGVIGAAHAGWKGALGNIAARTLQAMFDLGARPSDTSVAIGPCISKTNYETGPEFRDRFLAADVANAKFFDHRNFDLPGFILAQISGLGLKATHWTGHCTYADADRFFSFRRTTHAGASDYGRLISAIAL